MVLLFFLAPSCRPRHRACVRACFLCRACNVTTRCFLQVVIKTVQAHQALSSRTRQLNSTLRALLRFADQKGEWNPSEEVRKAFFTVTAVGNMNYCTSLVLSTF